MIEAREVQKRFIELQFLERFDVMKLYFEKSYEEA